MEELGQWVVELSALLEQRFGIYLRLEDNTQNLRRLVGKRVQELHCVSAQNYVKLLRNDLKYQHEFSLLLDVIRNGQTYFWRDINCFTAGIKLLQKSGIRQPWHIWSAGCSTGEEPYTMALLAAVHGHNVKITASDVDNDVLKKARSGVYSAWSLRDVPPDIQKSYFKQHGGNFTLTHSVRDKVDYIQHNLVDPKGAVQSPHKRGWDLILCRNVFIYFSHATLANVIKNFQLVLAESGWLCIGASETLHGLGLNLYARELDGRVFYSRTANDSDLDVAKPLTLNREVSKVVKLAPPKPKREHDDYTDAVAHIQKDEGEAARLILRKITEKKPDHLLAWITLGNLWLQEHDLAAALDCYSRAHDLSPTLAEIHYLQGVAFRKLSELDNAEKAFKRAIFLEPQFWPATFLLAGVYERQGKSTQHKRELQQTAHILAVTDLPPLFKSHGTVVESPINSMDDIRAQCRKYVGRAAALKKR